MLSLSALLNSLAPSSPILFSALSLTFRVVSLFGIALLFLHTCQVQFCQCCVCLQCFAQRTHSFTINLVACFRHFCNICVHSFDCNVASHIRGAVLSVLCWPSVPHSVHLLLQRWFYYLSFYFSWLYHSVLCGSEVLHTCQVQFCQCLVNLQCFTQRTCSFTIDLVACLKLWLVSYFGLVLRLLLLLRTCQSHCCQFCVDFQCLSQCTCSITDPVPCF